MKKFRQVPVKWAPLIKQLQEVVFPKGGFLPDSRGNYVREVQTFSDGTSRQARFRFGILGIRKEVRTLRDGAWSRWCSVGFCYYRAMEVRNGLVQNWSWERGGPLGLGAG